MIFALYSQILLAKRDRTNDDNNIKQSIETSMNYRMTAMTDAISLVWKELSDIRDTI